MAAPLVCSTGVGLTPIFGGTLDRTPKDTFAIGCRAGCFGNAPPPSPGCAVYRLNCGMSETDELRALALDSALKGRTVGRGMGLNRVETVLLSFNISTTLVALPSPCEISESLKSTCWCGVDACDEISSEFRTSSLGFPLCCSIALFSGTNG